MRYRYFQINTRFEQKSRILYYSLYIEENIFRPKNPELLQYPEYKFAKKLEVDPTDTSVVNNWTNFSKAPYYNLS